MFKCTFFPLALVFSSVCLGLIVSSERWKLVPLRRVSRAPWAQQRGFRVFPSLPEAVPHLGFLRGLPSFHREEAAAGPAQASLEPSVARAALVMSDGQPVSRGHGPGPAEESAWQEGLGVLRGFSSWLLSVEVRWPLTAFQ